MFENEIYFTVPDFTVLAFTVPYIIQYKVDNRCQYVALVQFKQALVNFKFDLVKYG